MKKIAGIVTFHDAINNGAFLQALGSYQFLTRHGYDASVIETGETFNLVESDNEAHNEWWQKYASRLKDCRKIIPITSKKYYDVLVYGSDEVWSFTNHGSNPVFWGFGVKASKKIAYAPCAGGFNIKNYLRNPLTTLKAWYGLRFNLDAISARDNATSKFVKFISGKDAVECLDPTFLGDFTPYKGDNSRGDYIVLYSYGFKEETIKQIKEFAKRNNCKTIFTGSYCDWADENPILTPLEWLSLMYHAKYVITSTFHGSVFSLICGREFYVMDTNSAKVNDLLARMSIEDRKVENLNQLPSALDYTIVNQRISKLRRLSEQYLLNNLK